MNYDLISLVSKLRSVETVEELAEVKALGESLMRKEKNYAILTLMAVADELGEEEIISSVEKLRGYLDSISRKKEI